MTYTSHGHLIPGSKEEPDQQPQDIARCGGAIGCVVCRTEINAYVLSKYKPRKDLQLCLVASSDHETEGCTYLLKHYGLHSWQIKEVKEVKELKQMAAPSLINQAADPNAPTAKDSPQSDLQHRFDLVDAEAMYEMTNVLYKGALKYGEDNWRSIRVEDHLNHLIAHAYAYLAGNRDDRHLANIMCRAMFAQGRDIMDRGQ